MYKDKLEIIMRVYFEKPRTTIGWKGLINDPHLDDSYDINTGLRRARSLLSYLATRGIPSATELLDPIVPQYIADLISWTAIGARTTESQTHREMASGLSMPIGFKNGTDGSFTTAINAMQSASKSHHFLGVNENGMASIVNTTGNPDGHIVLSRELAQQGIYPAIDVNQSVSRLMTDIVDPELIKNSQILKKYISKYNENRDLILMGGYVQGQDPDLDQAMQLWPSIIEFLKQEDEEECDFSKSIEQLKNLVGAAQ